MVFQKRKDNEFLLDFDPPNRDTFALIMNALVLNQNGRKQWFPEMMEIYHEIYIDVFHI